MSVSENSTLLPVAHENETSYQLMDGHAYGVGDLAVSSYEKSPYTDPDIICLYVGSEKTRFQVHRILLSQSPELNLKTWLKQTNNSIALPELDKVTAHTLIHYLYTGKYQALKSHEWEKKESTLGYKLSTCVYCAASRYGLPGLAELAKQRIRSFGENQNILEILGVARENVFPGLPDHESWFPVYIEDAIKTAVSEDPELFMKPEFVDQIEGDRKYRQVVMRAIVNTYSKGPSTNRERQTGLSTPVVDPKIDDSAPTEIKDLEPLSIENIEPSKNKRSQPNEVTVCEEAAIFANFIKEDVNLPKATRPTAELVQVPEQFTDEVGFGSSKTYQSLGKKADDIDMETAAKSKCHVPVHTRSDSVIETTEAAPVESFSVEDERLVTSPEPIDSVPLVVDGVNGSSVSKKKSKKKKKSYTSTSVPTENSLANQLK